MYVCVCVYIYIYICIVGLLYKVYLLSGDLLLGVYFIATYLFVLLLVYIIIHLLLGVLSGDPVSLAEDGVRAPEAPRPRYV